MKEPLTSFYGHVPLTTKRFRRIHRPVFFNPLLNYQTSQKGPDFILSGSEGSESIFMFQHELSKKKESKEKNVPVFSRGNLPLHSGDVGCIAAQASNVAVATEGGNVLMLSPQRK